MSTERHASPILISIVGPTAVGKTALAIALAQHFNTEVISADSRQMYGAIPIGTAQVLPEEQGGIAHHFMGHLELEESCSAGQFESQVLALMQAELKGHSHVVMAGGSGLFIKAVLEGLDDVPSDMGMRNTLNARHAEEGLEVLFEELAQLDPVCAGRIDRHNPQRVIRALEVCKISARPYSSFLTETVRERPFRSIVIGLRRTKEDLHARIGQRFDQMIEAGWLSECEQVITKRSLNSLNTIGYPPIFEHLEGLKTLDECRAQVIQDTQRFAKRQMTWFKKMRGIHWFDLPQDTLFDSVLEHIEQTKGFADQDVKN